MTKLFFLPIILCSVFVDACSSKKHLDNESQQKISFIKIVNFIKNNQRDSVYTNILNVKNENKIYNDDVINGARAIILASNRPYIIDSVYISDSNKIASLNKMTYNYSLNFYSDTTNIGTITISYFKDEAKLAISLYSTPNNEFDTTGLANEILNEK